MINQDGPLSTNDLEMMEQFLNFYHRILSKIDKETTQERRKLKELNNQSDALKAKINDHGSQATNNRRIEQPEVTISIHVGTHKIDIALEVSYLINNCSWRASYDIRVNNQEGGQPKTQLTYYGIIVSVVVAIFSYILDSLLYSYRLIGVKKIGRMHNFHCPPQHPLSVVPLPN